MSHLKYKCGCIHYSDYTHTLSNETFTDSDQTHTLFMNPVTDSLLLFCSKRNGGIPEECQGRYDTAIFTTLNRKNSSDN